MHITINRHTYSETSTIGKMHIDGKYVADTLEDKVRGPQEKKIWGQTAVPAGTFKIIVTYSPKFGVNMAEALGIPGFSKVRIHYGNKPEDTEGCWLVGTYNPKTRDWISASRDAYGKRVWPLILKAWLAKEPITITVTDGPH